MTDHLFRIFSYYTKHNFACFYADLDIIISQLQINVNLFCKKIIKQARKMQKTKI